LQDNFGNKSSKRLWASIFFSSALFLSLFSVIYDIFKPMELTAGIEIIKSLLASGCFLLGVSVAEYFGNKKNE
jgi:hypothetical protein